MACRFVGEHFAENLGRFTGGVAGLALVEIAITEADERDVEKGGGGL